MVETSRWILLLLPWVVACSKSSAPHDAGTEAQRLADHDGFDLVVFPDPGDPSRTLEGWVEQNALIAVPGDAGRR
jgi:hypothetical protein